MARRRLLGWICAAMLAVAACAVPAYAAGTCITGPAGVSAGEQISIAVTTTSSAFTGEVETEGLRVVRVSHELCTKSEVVLSDDFDDGSAVYTCAVTARPGDTVYFGVTDAVQLDGEEENEVYVAPWSTTVRGGAGAAEPDDDEPDEEPTQTQTAQPQPKPAAEDKSAATAEATEKASAAAQATVVKSGRDSREDEDEASPSTAAAATDDDDEDDFIGPSAREPQPIVAQAPAGRPTSTSGAAGSSTATARPTGTSSRASSAPTAKSTSSKDEDDDHLPSSGDVSTSIWILTIIGAAAGVMAVVAWRKVLSQL